MEIHWPNAIRVCFWNVSFDPDSIRSFFLLMNMNDSWKRALEKLFWFFFCMFCFFAILGLTILMQKN